MVKGQEMRVKRVDPIQDARSNMVFAQLKANGVTDKFILDAFEVIPREHFVPVVALPVAYGDAPVYCDVPGRYLFAPQTLGIFLQYLSLLPGDKVLIVGGNYGYTAAVLLELGCMAYVVESDPILVARCCEKLKEYNAMIQNAPLRLGLKEHGPYRAIIVEVGLSEIPDFIIDQLQENGKVAICMNFGKTNLAKAYVFEKRDNALHEVFASEANMPLCTEIESEDFTF